MTIPLHVQLREALDRTLDAKTPEERAAAKSAFDALVRSAYRPRAGGERDFMRLANDKEEA